jgi:hypothetical protein
MGFHGAAGSGNGTAGPQHPEVIRLACEKSATATLNPAERGRQNAGGSSQYPNDPQWEMRSNVSALPAVGDAESRTRGRRVDPQRTALLDPAVRSGLWVKSPKFTRDLLSG